MVLTLFGNKELHKAAVILKLKGAVGIRVKLASHFKTTFLPGDEEITFFSKLKVLLILKILAL